MLTHSQKDVTESLSVLKKDITNSIQNQIL